MNDINPKCNFQEDLAKKEMYRKISTFFGVNGQVKFSSSSESSGFFNFIPCFLHIEFTRFAAAFSVLKDPKLFVLPSIRNVVLQGFLKLLLFETPIYWELS
jgi:hypothetical protein